MPGGTGVTEPRVTAGDLLSAAGDALRRARLDPGPPAQLPGMREVIRELGQVTAALARYLDDLTPVPSATSAAIARLSGWPLAVVEARQALDHATRALGHDGRSQTSPPLPTEPIASQLASAAACFRAARDLLHTHLTPVSRGGPHASEWAPVILSPTLTRALAAEVAAAALQMAPVAAGLAEAASPRGGRADVARRRLSQAAQALTAAAAAIERAHRRDPALTGDQDLLYAVPVLLSPPPRILPGPETSPAHLKAGVISAAECLRHATWQPRPAWLPDATDRSLRHTAAAAVVTSYNCGATLDAVLSQARPCGVADAAPALRTAAATAGTARSRWLAVARAWSGHVVTDDSGEPSQVCAAAMDLAWWTGRLLYADPAWTPAHRRNSRQRPAGELAADAGSLGETVAAMHHAAHTLSRLAESDFAQVGQLARARRLYVRTRLLPDDHDIPRPFGPAPPDRVEALGAIYRGAEEASARLADAMDTAALAALAPSRTLASARAAVGRSVLPVTGHPADLADGPVMALLREMGISRPALLTQAARLDRQILAAGATLPRPATDRPGGHAEPEALP